MISEIIEHSSFVFDMIDMDNQVLEVGICVIRYILCIITEAAAAYLVQDEDRDSCQKEHWDVDCIDNDESNRQCHLSCIILKFDLLLSIASKDSKYNEECKFDHPFQSSNPACKIIFTDFYKTELTLYNVDAVKAAHSDCHTILLYLESHSHE